MIDRYLIASSKLIQEECLLIDMYPIFDSFLLKKLKSKSSEAFIQNIYICLNLNSSLMIWTSNVLNDFLSALI